MNSQFQPAPIPSRVPPVVTTPRAGPFLLAPLPYPDDALEPVISARTLRLHHGKHHQGYVETLNRLVAGTPFAVMSLEQVVLASARRPQLAEMFHNAAQAWNHAFYWLSMAPKADDAPPQKLEARIVSSFGSVKVLKEQLAAAATSEFGSGWVWLVQDGERLRVLKTDNADNPLMMGLRPLLTIDVWEHAYYLDVQNRRVEYVNGILASLLDWRFAAANLQHSKS
jgi:Fe-Mn family superoxide dismutase